MSDILFSISIIGLCFSIWCLIACNKIQSGINKMNEEMFRDVYNRLTSKEDKKTRWDGIDE